MQTALAGLLAKRDLATRAARDWLVEHGAELPIAEAAIADFTARGYLNDARYAEKYVNYAARRGQGPARIARDLRGSGISAEQISLALDAGPNWCEVCEDVRRRRFGAKAPVSWADKGRQARFLQYRGFSSDHMRLATDFDSTDTPDD